MMPRGRKTSYAVLTAALALTSGPALACEIMMPLCTSASNGRLSQLYTFPAEGGEASLFFEYDAAETQPETMMLVECRSRKGVEIRLSEDPEGWMPKTDVLDYVVETFVSEKSYTLSQIREGLRTLGADTRMTTLPAGHCGCDLPKMETIGCGDG